MQPEKAVIGKKVCFDDPRAHIRDPRHYPEQNTVGIIREVEQNGVKVQWLRGTVGYHGLCFAKFHQIKAVM